MFFIFERRNNWNQDALDEADELNKLRRSLLQQYLNLRCQIVNVGLDFKEWDRLKAEQRNIIAKLATL